MEQTLTGRIAVVTAMLLTEPAIVQTIRQRSVEPARRFAGMTVLLSVLPAALRIA